MQFSHVEVDGVKGPSFLTDVKVVLLDKSNYQRHVKITHEGIFVDLIGQDGEVVDSWASEHNDMLAVPDEHEPADETEAAHRRFADYRKRGGKIQPH